MQEGEGAKSLHPQGFRRHPKGVNPLRFFVDAFVNTFGITQPAPGQESRAGRYIALMLAGVLLLLGVVGWVVRSTLLK